MRRTTTSTSTTSSRRTVRIPLRLLGLVAAVLAVPAAGLLGPARPAAAAGPPTEVTSFGSNPGNLQMYAYVPAGLPAGAPLVLALHGCTQDAAGYAAGSGWTELADRLGLVVVLPQQRTANNSSRCFNWFEPGDTTRGQGEAASVSSMVARARSTWGTDPARTFVTGLSAGGAMTSSLLAAYPDLFAGGAVVAGVPAGCATSTASAFGCMSAPPDRTPAQQGAAVRAKAPSGTTRWPTVAIWHGTSDTTVSPANATESRDQWTDVHGLPSTPTATSSLPGGTSRADYADASGTVRVSTFTISGMGHATPNDPGSGATQCGTAGAYFADTICSSWYSAELWGLTGPTPPPTTTPPPTSPTTPPTTDPSLGCWTASSYAHTQAGRAYQSGGYAYALGSGDALGLWNTYATSSLEQTGPSWYERVSSC